MIGEEKRVYFHDSEHIWIDGKQYIGLTRVEQMVQEAKKEMKDRDPCKSCPYWPECRVEKEDKRWCFVRILTLMLWKEEEKIRGRDEV